MNPKAITLTEKMGFKDPDLTTPEHDKMILWLLDENNLSKVITTIFPDLRIYYVDRKNDDEKISETHFYDANKIIPKVTYNLKTEHVVLNTYNRFIIGFIDIKFTVSSYFRDDLDKLLFINFEKYTKTSSSEISFLIEVKPEIRSFGEVVRQIETYKTYEKGIYIIVTKKTQFKPYFEQNGIYVYEMEP